MMAQVEANIRRTDIPFGYYRLDRIDVEFTAKRPRGILEIGIAIKKGVEYKREYRSFDETDALSLTPNLICYLPVDIELGVFSRSRRPRSLVKRKFRIDDLDFLENSDHTQLHIYEQKEKVNVTLTFIDLDLHIAIEQSLAIKKFGKLRSAIALVEKSSIALSIGPLRSYVGAASAAVDQLLDAYTLQNQYRNFVDELVEDIEALLVTITADPRFESGQVSTVTNDAMSLLRLIRELSLFIIGITFEDEPAIEGFHRDEADNLRKEFEGIKEDYDWSLKAEALHSAFVRAQRRTATRLRRELGVYFERQETLPECDTLSETAASDTTCVNIITDQILEDGLKDASSSQGSSPEQKSVEIVQTPIEYVLSLLPKTLDLTESDLRHDKMVESINGGFGNVTMGRLRRLPHKREILVAIKSLREDFKSNARFAKSFAKEIHCWATLEHKNIVKLEGFVLGNNGFPSLVSRWATHGRVVDYLVGNPGSDVIGLARGICDGLAYLHGRDIVHSDLKGSNIVVDENGQPMITDFGLSRMMSYKPARLNTTPNDAAFGAGSIRWMAYEFFYSDHIGENITTQGEEQVQVMRHTKESDMWAFGMVTYELLTKKIPYFNINLDFQVVTAILLNNLPLKPKLLSTSEQALWDLCGQCWKRHPEERVNILQAQQFLSSIALTS